MNRQQAINYLLSSGFSEEQINTIEQAFKQEPTNDLGVGLISREQAKTAIRDKFKDLPSRVEINTILNELPSVTPQEPCDKCEVGNPCLYCKHQYEPTTKNDSSELEKNSKKLEKDLGESDCISRAQAQTEIEMNASRYTIAKERGGTGQVEWSDQLIKVSDAVDIIRNLPPATPQEPQSFKWCTDCKEYDQEKHCCHRWSKVIRDTVEEMKQEPKSEWQHDHEILKAYSDGANEVLDKIRAEIETKYGQCDICEYFEDYDYEENDISEYRAIGNIADILQIIDKYTAESAHDVAQEIVKNNGIVEL